MTKSKTAPAATARPDHNQMTEREQWEEQQFFTAYNELKEHRSEMAGIKGEMGGLYKRLKDIGFSKKDIEFAMTLEDKDVSEVIRDFEQKLRVARMFGHQLGRQLDLLDTDRTPEVDKAYQEGLANGKMRGSSSNPYGMNTEKGQAWQKGMNDGTEFINKELSEKVPEAAE